MIVGRCEAVEELQGHRCKISQSDQKYRHGGKGDVGAPGGKRVEPLDQGPEDRDELAKSHDASVW